MLATLAHFINHFREEKSATKKMVVLYGTYQMHFSSYKTINQKWCNNWLLTSLLQVSSNANPRMGNAAIVVTLVVTILVSNINAQDNLNDTYQDDQCSIDTRVATLRCLSISLESVQEALNQWDLTNVNRLEINRMSPSKKISRLRSISDDSKMLKLSEIFLVNSGLEELGERSLDGFDTNELESIDLSWNELTQVPQVVLKLGKLRHLDLSHNKIFSLPPGSSFNNLNALATLKLSGNK